MNPNLLLLLTLLQPHPTPAFHRVSDELRKRLDAEEQNSICCRNGLGCCRESEEKSTSFEVKAVVTDCPNLRCTNFTGSHKVVTRQNDKFLSEKLTDCQQKLLLTINMVNEGRPSVKSQYVIIDHIVDSMTLKKVRILNPYAVRIRQDPLLEVYTLSFERAINGEAREKVYNNNNDANYRGCSTEGENPTCEVVKHEGKRVPYSTGFCCSCDPHKNILMEQEGGQWPPVPEYRKDDPGENDYEHYKHHGFTGEDGKMVYERSQKRADKRVNYHQFTDLKDGKIRQRRGGQSCDDVDIDTLPESFQESTHCLTFSNLWYSVYQLGKPWIYHKVRVQIFQKYEDCHGNTHWMDLTLGKVVELGTNQKIWNDKNIVATYLSEPVPECDNVLNFQAVKLLVPEKRVVDPNQFMVLPKNLISENGKTCDTAGVGYEAFYKQKKRCALPKGSCLANQPEHLRDHDLKAEQEGRSGNYFLKFYGKLAEEPVGYNSTGHIQYLKMMYTKRHASKLYFEMNADLITLLKPHTFATITEIYSDATNPQKTRIIVKVTNSGLMYGVFYVRLSGCSLQVPASFNNIASKSVLILPQHQHIFNLYVEYSLPVQELYCSIHVHNINQELIAVRPVRIQTYDRCICIWHCECACYVVDRGLKCTPMSLEAYHQAGFQGGFSFSSELVETSYLDRVFALVLDMFMFLVVTLLIMGLIKAILGLCFEPIGLWGLDTILGTEEEESDSSTRCGCDNDDCQWKKQKNDGDGISLAAQFCLNIVFFFIYPLALVNNAFKKLCFSKYTMEHDSSYERRFIDYGQCDEECEDDCNVNRTRSKVGNSGSMASSTDRASMTSRTSRSSRRSNRGE